MSAAVCLGRLWRGYFRLDEARKVIEKTVPGMWCSLVEKNWASELDDF